MPAAKNAFQDKFRRGTQRMIGDFLPKVESENHAARAMDWDEDIGHRDPLSPDVVHHGMVRDSA